jgi:hypothetical protein
VSNETLQKTLRGEYTIERMGVGLQALDDPKDHTIEQPRLIEGHAAVAFFAA